MMKIIVTGASGFIGTNILQFYVKSRNEVLNLDFVVSANIIKNALFQQVDITDYESLKKTILHFKPEYIIHLAARTDLDEKNDIDGYVANIKGVDNLIRVCNQCQSLKRVIFASSMLVCKAGYMPKNESDYCPPNLYGESKVKTEEIIRANCQGVSYDWCIIRPTSIWGPFFGEPYRNFFDIVKAGRFFHPGNEACTKTYGYVGNAVYQIDKLLFAGSEQIHQKVFYIGDSSPIQISQWADEIAAEIGLKIRKLPWFLFKLLALFGDVMGILGIKFPMTSFRLKNMTTDNIIDLDSTCEVAPHPPYSRSQGIKETLRWMESGHKEP